MNSSDTYLTIDELARELRISSKTLERMRACGFGPPAIKLGQKRLIYSRAAINHWLASRQERVRFPFDAEPDEPPEAA